MLPYAADMLALLIISFGFKSCNKLKKQPFEGQLIFVRKKRNLKCKLGFVRTTNSVP